MDVYATEEQQVEAVKKWFKKYGNTLLWILAIVMSCIAAVNYWRHHQAVVQEQASELYMGLLGAMEQKDPTTATVKLDQLIKDHPKSPYAALGAFAVAKNEVTTNNLVAAEKHLRWVNENGKQPNFQALARIRLMHLLVDQNKLEDALGLYDETKAGDYITLMAEIKGDILLKQNNRAGAVQSYELAFKSAPQDGMYGPLLKMKLENLGIEATK